MNVNYDQYIFLQATMCFSLKTFSMAVSESPNDLTYPQMVTMLLLLGLIVPSALTFIHYVKFNKYFADGELN